MSEQKRESVKAIEDPNGSFCPVEVIDRVEDLFIIRERDGRTVERQLGIRRNLLEKALRHAINRYRNPHGPKPMQRAVTAQPALVRRTA
jgi:hypothetical protein